MPFDVTLFAAVLDVEENIVLEITSRNTKL